MIKDYIKKEFKCWSGLYGLWLVFATAITLAISIYCKDSAIGIIAAITGIWYTITIGMGKTYGYVFGIINTIGYSIVSFENHYYGEVMLNILYFLPMCFIGIALWRKNRNDNDEVIKKRMSLKNSLAVYSMTAVLIAVYGFILKALGNTLPFIDSMSTIISIVAQILCVRRYMEQWVLWMMVNGVTVIMWLYAVANGSNDIATLAMWIVYLLTGIFMFIKWLRETK